MPELCLITTCMGRLAHLQQSLPAAAGQRRCSCVVVDYSCPEHAGDWVEEHHPAAKVVRVAEQARFNVSRARNAGAAVADAPWLCFFDADVILADTFAERVLPTLVPDTFYTVHPWQSGLTGTMICSRSAFARIGGFDEVFASWGEEDVDFCDRLRLYGFHDASYPLELVTQIAHDDAQRVQHYAIKSTQVSQTINLLYRLAKLDLMRLLGRDLSEDERRTLHAEALRAVPINEQDGQWRIEFRQARSLLGLDIATTLVFTLRAPRPSPG
jgi:glycosyltransferase involved in cell wall biosynthesis